MQAIGQFLRQLRRERSLTLEQAARAAGIGRVTLNRWETGNYQPRLAELDALLTALGADVRKKQEALARLDAPRAREQVYQAVNRIAEQTGIGPRPHGGDALRALRQRRRMSLEEVAERLGVTPRTLRRWEKAEVWPSVEQLHRLCFVVDAYEEEIVALTCGPFARPFEHDAMPLSVDDLKQQLTFVLQQVQSGEPAMTELLYLALEAKAWSLAAKSIQGQQMLADVYTYHAFYLEYRGRLEYTQIAERALDLIPEKTSKESDFIRAAILSAPVEQDPARAFTMLRQWLPIARKPYIKAWILSHMAICLAAQGAQEEALVLAENASQIAVYAERRGEVERRKYVQADLLLQIGRAGEAAALLIDVEADTPYFGGHLTLMQGETLLAAGEPAEARCRLQHAFQLIKTYDLTHLTDRAVSLAQQLPSSDSLLPIPSL